MTKLSIANDDVLAVTATELGAEFDLEPRQAAMRLKAYGVRAVQARMGRHGRAALYDAEQARRCLQEAAAAVRPVGLERRSPRLPANPLAPIRDATGRLLVPDYRVDRMVVYG